MSPIGVSDRINDDKKRKKRKKSPQRTANSKPKAGKGRGQRTQDDENLHQIGPFLEESHRKDLQFPLICREILHRLDQEKNKKKKGLLSHPWTLNHSNNAWN